MHVMLWATPKNGVLWESRTWVRTSGPRISWVLILGSMKLYARRERQKVAAPPAVHAQVNALATHTQGELFPKQSGQNPSHRDTRVLSARGNYRCSRD